MPDNVVPDTEDDLEDDRYNCDSDNDYDVDNE